MAYKYIIRVLIVSIVYLSILSAEWCVASDVSPIVVAVPNILTPVSAAEYIQEHLMYSAKSGKEIKFTSKDGHVYIGKEIKIYSGCNVDFNNIELRRVVPGDVFDVIVNGDQVNGGQDINISNLRIDGNKDLDNRRAENVMDRFSGISLIRVKNSVLRNVQVVNTVNGEEQKEGGRAGIYFENCRNITAYNIGGSHNDRTAIFIKNSSVSIYGSYTHHNKGSGISGNNAYECQYYDIVTHDNGYSQLSINGKNSKASRITAYNGARGYSNVNIGHNIPSADASNTVLTDLQSYDGKGWGLTVAGSNNVVINNARISGNEGANVYVFDNANNLSINNVSVYGSGSNGIYVKDGEGHKINEVRVYDNSAHGIEIGMNASATIGPLADIYNNGRRSRETVAAGLAVVGKALVTGGNFYNNDKSANQAYGLWAAGGMVKASKNVNVYGNRRANYMENSGGHIMPYMND